MIFLKPPQEETNLETEYLLQDVPMQTWAFSSRDIGKVKSATPIKMIIDNTLHLPNMHQYPLRPVALYWN